MAVQKPTSLKKDTGWRMIGGHPVHLGGSSSHNFEGMATVTDNVNAIPMKHMTSAGAVESIRKDGFNFSGNSMYGRGVYFSNQAAYGGSGKATVEVELSPHKQLVIPRDVDAPKVLSIASGIDQKFIQVDHSLPQKMVKAGYGSARIDVGDGETYTLVFDPKLIRMK